MTEKLFEHDCPFCGQKLIFHEDFDPRRMCGCAEAVRYSANQESLEDMQDMVDELFGTQRTEASSAFVPANKDVLHQLKNLCAFVNAGLLEKVSLTLDDGSVCTMNQYVVNRRMTVKR